MRNVSGKAPALLATAMIAISGGACRPDGAGVSGDEYLSSMDVGSNGGSETIQEAATASSAVNLKVIPKESTELSAYLPSNPGVAYSFSIVSGGGSIDERTGAFTAPDSGSVTVSVMDSEGNETLITLDIDAEALVMGIPSITLNSGEVADLFRYVSGGAGTYTFDVLEGPGSVDPATGEFFAGAMTGSTRVRVTDGRGNHKIVVVRSVDRNLLKLRNIYTEGAKVIETAAYGGARPYDSNLENSCQSFWGAQGTLCDEGKLYENSPDISAKSNTHSGATWWNDEGGRGTGVIVVDLGSTMSLNVLQAYRMYSNGDVKQIRFSAHPSQSGDAPAWDDSGWAPISDFVAMGEGENLGYEARCLEGNKGCYKMARPTSVQLPTQVQTRFVRVEARSDTALIELRAVKAF